MIYAILSFIICFALGFIIAVKFPCKPIEIKKNSGENDYDYIDELEEKEENEDEEEILDTPDGFYTVKRKNYEKEWRKNYDEGFVTSIRRSYRKRK